jgi:hypothetical protein
LNIQSVNNKKTELTNFLIRNNFHVFALNETCLSKGKQLKIPGYCTYRKERVGQKVGFGFCVLIKDEIVSTEERITISQNTEALVVRLKGIMCNQKDLVLIVYYNHPN